jgi:hypothetical protein
MTPSSFSVWASSLLNLNGSSNRSLLHQPDRPVWFTGFQDQISQGFQEHGPVLTFAGIAGVGGQHGQSLFHPDGCRIEVGLRLIKSPDCIVVGQGSPAPVRDSHT